MNAACTSNRASKMRGWLQKSSSPGKPVAKQPANSARPRCATPHSLPSPGKGIRHCCCCCTTYESGWHLTCHTPAAHRRLRQSAAQRSHRAGRPHPMALPQHPRSARAGRACIAAHGWLNNGRWQGGKWSVGCQRTAVQMLQGFYSDQCRTLPRNCGLLCPATAAHLDACHANPSQRLPQHV